MVAGPQLVLVVLTALDVALFIHGMKRFFRRTDSGGGVALVKLGSVVGWSLILAEEMVSSPPLWRVAASAVLLIGSALLFRWAARVVQSRPLTYVFSLDAPQHVVQTGPYRFIRHPFYTSYCAVFVSGAVALGTAETMAMAFIMTALYTYAARLEEQKFSRSPLAAEYGTMKKRTGMLLPRLFR